MRILLINYEYPPVGGGGADATKGLAEGYAKRGHETIVLTARWNALPRLEKVNDCLAIHRIFAFRKAIAHCTPPRMFAFMLLGIPPAIRLARKWKPDVIHCHFAIPVGFIGLVAKKLTGIPYVVTFQGGDVPGFVPEQTDRYYALVKPLANRVVKNASFCVAVGTGLQKLAIEKYRRPDILYIPNGVDVEIFKPRGERAPREEMRIVFAARFNPQKGLNRLIEAVKLLEERGITNPAVAGALAESAYSVKVYGGGPLEREMKTLSTNYGLDHRIRFMGWVKREELSVRLGEADIFVIPSDIEGMPLGCLQAMASGLAIVGSRAPGISEVVRDGENGILVEVGDVRGLADALERLLNDRALIRKMGERGRQLAHEEFRWDVIVEQYLNLFARLKAEKIS
jgi:glycosyltransferase involved in cell wall biosynthesis